MFHRSQVSKIAAGQGAVAAAVVGVAEAAVAEKEGAGAGTRRLRRPRVAAVGEISGDKPSQALSLKNKIISDFFTEKKYTLYINPTNIS